METKKPQPLGRLNKRFEQNRFLSLLGLVLYFSACRTSGHYQGNPLFGFLQPEPIVLQVDARAVLQRYPNYLASSYEFPVGGPFAEGFYVAQKFGVANSRFGGKKHLGEDWNALTGGDSDFAAPVYAFGNGVVSETSDYGGGWGKVIRIVHGQKTKTGSFLFLESLYAHLHTVDVIPGQLVSKGEWIGTIGDADRTYTAHLHLELRNEVGLPLGGGYGDDLSSFYSPTIWLSQFGPKGKPISEEMFFFPNPPGIPNKSKNF